MKLSVFVFGLDSDGDNIRKVNEDEKMGTKPIPVDPIDTLSYQAWYEDVLIRSVFHHLW